MVCQMGLVWRWKVPRCQLGVPTHSMDTGNVNKQGVSSFAAHFQVILNSVCQCSNQSQATLSKDDVRTCLKRFPTAPLKSPGVYLCPGPLQVCCALRYCLWQFAFGGGGGSVKLNSKAVYIQSGSDGAVWAIS